MRSVLIFSAALFLFSSCIVTKKKYDELLAQKVRTDADLADRTAELEKANASLKDLEDKLDKLKGDTTDLCNEVRSMTRKLSDLDKEYTQLNTYYKNLLTNSGKLNRDMAQQQEQLLAIQENLGRTRHE